MVQHVILSESRSFFIDALNFFVQSDIVPSAQHYRLHSFDFDDEAMTDHDTFKVKVLSVFGPV